MIKIRKSLPEFETELDGCTFKMRPLSEIELEQVNFYLADMIKAGHTVLPPKAITYCLENCLLSWKGVKDENGGDLKYYQGSEIYLPAKIRMALASDIYVQSTMSEDEKKSL